MKAVIYLDIDGVLAQCAESIVTLFGRTIDDYYASAGGAYSLAPYLGVTEAEVWRRVEQEGADFWAHLPPYSGAMALVAECEVYAPTYLCTSPTLDPACAQGKVAWIQRHFGRHFRRYFITPHKSHLARPGALLIDDHAVNVDAFVEAGGASLIVPRPWNPHYEAFRASHPLPLESIASVCAALKQATQAVSQRSMPR